MTNEQREAIELAKEFTKMDFSNPMGWTGYCDAELEELSQAIETVLSLIKEQQEKMKNKDKQIDLMAELVYKRFKAELLLEYGFENEDQLKQYFAGLVEKGQ